jgi:CheY-like chemotaxis protein
MIGTNDPVLIVEDDADVREALALLVEHSGYPAVTAADGRQALQLLGAGLRARLIILDLMMPVLDGWGFRAAQMRQPRFAAIPTVVCSAREDAGEQAEQMGALAGFVKPVDVDRVLALIERCTASH